MKNRPKLFVLFCVVFLSMLDLAEAMQPVTMRGRIRFSGDQSPGVVRIQLRGIGQVIEDQYPRDGSFAFEVAPGPYEISIQAAGYDSSTETLNIRGNEECAFQLRSSMPSASADTKSVLDYQIPASARKELDAGRKLRAKRDCAGALDCFRKAIEIFDRYADAHAEMGSCSADLADWDSAASEFKRSLDIRSSVVVALNLVDVYRAQHRDGEAEDQLKRSIDPFLQQHRARTPPGVSSLRQAVEAGGA